MAVYSHTKKHEIPKAMVLFPVPDGEHIPVISHNRAEHSLMEMNGSRYRSIDLNPYRLRAYFQSVINPFHRGGLSRAIYIDAC